MASLNQDQKSKIFRILFWYGGRQHHKSLKTTDRRDAEALKGRIEETLQAIEKGWATVPHNADLWQFLFSGGKREGKPAVADVLCLEGLFDRYEHMLPAGTIEANSLSTKKLHRKHLLRILGGRRAAQTLETADLQSYINRRAKESYRGKPINARTVKKEVDTFRSVWNWAAGHSLLTGPAPVRGLQYAKGDEKPLFMTWGEIERRVRRGGLTEQQVGDLWDCLFLDAEQVNEVLAYVKEHAAFPFIYPMFVFVAHTGARRSEMCRSQIEDLDFAENRVRLREKKKDRSVMLTFRHVPMSPLFREVMQEWVQGGHPGGPYTICQGLKTRTKLRAEFEPLTKNEASHHFQHTLAGGKWEKVRGFHASATRSRPTVRPSGSTRGCSTSGWGTRPRRCGDATAT